jgi:tetratricopeptide (TPR) repeat protein
MRRCLLGFTVLLIAAFAWGTYVRNFAWKNEKTLWEDAHKKAPGSHRPYHNLAQTHYVKIGDYQEAIRLYEKSLQLRMNSGYQKALTLNNLALLHLQKNDPEKAIARWEQAIVQAPNLAVVRHRYAIGLVEMRRFGDALIHIDHLVAGYPHNPGYNYLKGYALLNQEKYSEALLYFKKCLNAKPRWGQALLGAGICHYFLEEYKKAETAFQQALDTGRQQALTLLWLVETNLKTDDSRETELYLARLREIISFEDLVALLKSKQQKDFLTGESKRALEITIRQFYGKNKISRFGFTAVEKWKRL